MACRDSAGIRLLTRNGYDWAARYPLIVEAVKRLKARSCLTDGEAVDRLKVRSCLIDGEAVACDETGLAVFAQRRTAGGHPRADFPHALAALNRAEMAIRPVSRAA